MPPETKHIVIDMQLVDVDRFNRRWPSRERVKIPCCETGKHIPFENEIDLEVRFRRIPKRNLPADCVQNWSMKNNHERRAYSEADQQTMPNPTVASHLFVIVFGHYSDCIAASL